MEWLAVIFVLLFNGCLFALCSLILLSLHWREEPGICRVQVVVLGDVGRSPRMQYHCLSLIQQHYNVDYIGYSGSALIKSLQGNPRLTQHFLPEVPEAINRLPNILRYVFKVVYQFFSMIWVVTFKTKKPACVLLQTPPAIPAQIVMFLLCLMRGSKLIVDYHNYGFSIMALTLGPKHFIVTINKYYEKILSHLADVRLCVSSAMKKDMQKHWGVSSIVLYDRPPPMFQPCSSPSRKHEYYTKLAQSHPEFRDKEKEDSDNSNRTRFTEVSPIGARLRQDRPFLLVSSTSWTEDEDFSILLKALEAYDKKANRSDSSLPHVLCIITGKGPLKSHYERIIKEKNLKQVEIVTMWLQAEDYPLLLAVADLGVCLHKSSSGLDLPMKIVDMFGSGLPVCAVYFDCLSELLQDEYNGLVFKDHVQLSQQLERLCSDFPALNSSLQQFKNNLVSFQSLRWEHYWKLHIHPLISAYAKAS